jgi:glycosyltransferase involved in cell wall biosynthesis
MKDRATEQTLFVATAPGVLPGDGGAGGAPGAAGDPAAPHICLLGDARSVHLRRWAKEMLARGFRVSVITARPEPIEGVEQRALAPVTRSHQWLGRVGQARRHLRELAPDLVHAHYVTSYGYLAARSGRHPLVLTAWGSDILVTPNEGPLVRALTRWTLRQADLITGDSQDLLAAITRFRPKAPLRQIHFGADMALFRPVDWGAKRGFQIVSLRSWEPNYNIDVVVQAVATLARRWPDAGVHLHLLGGGSLGPDLQAQVDALGLTGQVSFLGRVGDAEMVAALQASKVSISVPTSDATSVSVLESMACGVAVVASDLPANRQWLAAEEGLRVAPRDAQALAAVLEALCSDDDRTRRIGAGNYQRMRIEGGRQAQMNRVATLYRELLAAHPLPVKK